MNKLAIAIIVVVVLIGGFYLLNRPAPEMPVTVSSTADRVQKETSEAYHAIADYTQEKKDQLVADVNAQMDAMQDDIQDMADSTKKNTSEAYNDAMDNIREKREVVADKLARARDASGEAWEHAKAELSDAMNDLREAYNHARHELAS